MTLFLPYHSKFIAFQLWIITFFLNSFWYTIQYLSLLIMKLNDTFFFKRTILKNHLFWLLPESDVRVEFQYTTYGTGQIYFSYGQGETTQYTTLFTSSGDNRTWKTRTVTIPAGKNTFVSWKRLIVATLLTNKHANQIKFQTDFSATSPITIVITQCIVTSKFWLWQM